MPDFSSCIAKHAVLMGTFISKLKHLRVLEGGAGWGGGGDGGGVPKPTSTVECMIKRVTCTGRVWPMRWARPTACCSMAGSMLGSNRNT